MRAVLGLDLGTSYFKAVVATLDNQLLGLGRVASPLESAGPERTMPVEKFWSSLRQAVEQALTSAALGGGDIEAISYSSQANTFVLLDGQDNALTPLISWSDERADRPPGPLRELFAESDFMQTTGMGVEFSPAMAAAKLLWIQQNEPGLWAKARRFMTITDYLAWSLTGSSAGDESTCELLGMWDVLRRQWWGKALSALNVNVSMLSSPMATGAIVGPVVNGAALGIADGAWFVAGALDHYAAAVGAGLEGAAGVAESTGTVLAAVRQMDAYNPIYGCCTAAAAGGRYYRLAFDGHGASMLEEYQRLHAPKASVEELISLAAKMTEPHGPEVRRIMQTTADTMHGLLMLICDGSLPQEVISTGGGAKSRFWLDMKARVAGCTFTPRPCTENGAIGAAVFASRAIGASEG